MPRDVVSLVGRYVPFKVRLTIIIVITFCCIVNIKQSKTGTETTQTRRAATKNNESRVLPPTPRYVPRKVPNLLSEQVIPSGSLSTRGWWMSHVNWDVEEMKRRSSKTEKRQVLGAQCSIHRIVDTYQYMAVNKDMPIDSILFTVSSASLKLRLPYEDEHTLGSDYDPFYDARLYVAMNDGTTRYVKFEFNPTRKNKMTRKKIKFIVPRGKRVTGIMVTLACFGYKGYVAYTDLAVTPQTNAHMASDSLSDYLSPCPSTRNHSLGRPQILFSKVVRAIFSPKDKRSITMVMQLTYNRLDELKEALKNWDGPVSVCIYVKVDEDESLDETREEVEEVVNAQLFRRFSTAHVTLLYGHEGGARYPINYLRNVAIKNTKTKYILPLDVDFVPSRGLQRIARRHIQSYVAKHHGAQRVGFVVPAFEIKPLRKKVRNPRKKSKLMALIQNEVVSPFRLTESPLSHESTNYEEWYIRDEPYEITAYQDKYEPYVILRRTPNLPLYDERFTGYGMNKISHIMELALLRYKFVVLPNVWIIHRNHRTSKLSIAHRMNPDIRFVNRLQRYQFLSDLNAKHGLGGCRKNIEQKLR